MGAESKEKVSDSVKDNRTDSVEENNEKDKERTSLPDSKSDIREAEEKDIGEMILSYLKELLDAEKQENVDRLDKNDFSNDTSEEKKEVKGDDLSHIKDNSEEKKETKWDSIDWNKDNSEVKEETKWDSIDWSKDYSSEEEKIEGSKNDNIDDNLKTNGEDNEKIEDSNLNEKKSDENIDNNEYHKKEYEGINDNLEEKEKEYEVNGNNENDYESNLGREGTETLLFPSEHPEELLEQANDYKPKNNSEQLLDRKSEEIDEFELITPEGKPEKPAEPPEIMELVEEGSYNSDYTSEQETELSQEIEPKNELEDPLEHEFLNESEDRQKEELEKELELINPETGEPIPHQPDWEYIPLQDYLEQLREQQENRDEAQKIEAEQEKIKKSDQESEFMPEQSSEIKSEKKSEKLFDQNSEFIPNQESKYDQGEINKKGHITEKEKNLISSPKDLNKSKHHDYKQLIKTKYDPIFSQTQLRKAQNKTEKSYKRTEISQKTKKKSRTDDNKELDLIHDPAQVKKKEKRHEIEVKSSSEQDHRISSKLLEKDEDLETYELLKAPKEEKLKENQKKELTSSELLELQERYRQETGKRPIYNKKQTKGYKEWLKNQKESIIKQSESNRKSEIREEWELILVKWIKDANKRHISQEIKEELLHIIKKYRKCRKIYRKLIQLSESNELSRKKFEEIEKFIQKLEETTNIQTEIFKNLRAFRAFYNENIRWYKHHITAEKQKFLRHLSQKLTYLKETKNAQNYIKQNWKEILKDNLYKNKMLNLQEKPLINKILQKEELTEHEKKELISILSKFPTEELIPLLGNDFKKHTQNYIKWGWDYDQGVKREMLKKYLTISKYTQEISIENSYAKNLIQNNMNDNFCNKNLNLLINKNNSIFTASKGFAGKQYNRAIDEIYRKIRDEKTQIADFDDDALITDIISSLNVDQKLKKVNKSLREQRRREKRRFISQYGKIIVELLNPQSGVIYVNEISTKYGVSYSTVYKIIKYLKTKYKTKFKLKSSQPSIEVNSSLLSNPTYILIEGIKKQIECQLGDKISYQFLARDILMRPENFIAKKYSYIRSGRQGSLNEDVFFDIKLKTINFFIQKGFTVPNQLNKEFKIYNEYLVKTPKYIPSVKLTPELIENPTFKFFDNIKSEIEKFLDRKITNREFSKNILGRPPQFLEHKFSKIRKNENLGILMQDLFMEVKTNIITFFTKNKAPISDKLNDIFDNYEDYLVLARYARSDEISKKFHPLLKSNFFKNINSKEKAYWLGFMYADGYVIVRIDRSDSKTIGMTVSVKDEEILDLLIKTLGLNMSLKNYYNIERINKNNITKTSRYCRINWNHQSMADDLVTLGVVPNKSKIIRIPKLHNEELYLAFILGYFDGDGQEGTTRIFSGSKEFLKDIKLKFNIRNAIKVDHRTEYIHPITQKVVKKSTNVYRLALGSELFNKMLKNYQNSLERKRINYTKPRKYKEDYTTRKELDKLIWEMPMNKIAKNLNVSTDYIKKWCDEWDISRPDPSHWPSCTAGRKKKK